MPNIVSHFVCSKLVAEKLEITSNEYLKGNLYPDYVDKEKHYRTKGTMFEIPDINKFIKEEQIKNKLFKLGFLTHLILDKLFLEDYCINQIYTKIDNNIYIFDYDKIYRDYTNISKKLLTLYNLNLTEIEELLTNEKNIDTEKYTHNINLIKESTSDTLQYIELNSYINFLETSSDYIAKYIKRKKYL